MASETNQTAEAAAAASKARKKARAAAVAAAEAAGTARDVVSSTAGSVVDVFGGVGEHYDCLERKLITPSTTRLTRL
jgi:biotin carboxyl carrier protein